MRAGLAGLRRAETELGVAVEWIENVKAGDEAEGALMKLAEKRPDLVIGHGGQIQDSVARVAQRHPDLRFAAVQGAVVGRNLASYEVLQEQSAWLAGALAAMMSRSHVVGHMAGGRFPAALKARAAFLQGARETNPNVRALTNFSGDPDDPDLARRIALAMAEAGADIIFTMLNDGRAGVTAACRLRGIAQIGNVADWTKIDPDVFVASAIADSGLALYAAVLDLTKERFEAGRVVRMGLGYPGAVRLAMRDDIPQILRERISSLSVEIAGGKRRIATEWSGEEFAAPV